MFFIFCYLVCAPMLAGSAFVSDFVALAGTNLAKENEPEEIPKEFPIGLEPSN